MNRIVAEVGEYVVETGSWSSVKRILGYLFWLVIPPFVPQLWSRITGGSPMSWWQILSMFIFWAVILFLYGFVVWRNEKKKFEKKLEDILKPDENTADFIVIIKSLRDLVSIIDCDVTTPLHPGLDIHRFHALKNWSITLTELSDKRGNLEILRNESVRLLRGLEQALRDVPSLEIYKGEYERIVNNLKNFYESRGLEDPKFLCYSEVCYGRRNNNAQER